MGLLNSIANRLGYASQGQVRQAVDQVVRDYSLAFPSPMLAGIFGGGGSSTGVPVTPLSALQSATVYACVRRKAEDLAKLPVLVERDMGGDGWQQDLLHPLNELLKRPNQWMTPFEFWRYLSASLDLRGNAFCVIRRGWDAAPEALIPINWDRVSVLLSPRGELFYNISHPAIGTGITFHQDDVIHLRGLTIDGGYIGMSAIVAAQDVTGLALATQQHGAVLFRQGAQIPMVLKHPGKLTKEVADRIAQSWRDAYGGVQNSHKTAVLEEGMDVKELAMTNEDSQFLQTRAFQVVEICRLLGVPPHKVYDLSKANFSTLEQQEQAYVNDTLDTLASNVQDNARMRLFFRSERDSYRIRFDFSSLLRGDQKARSEAYASGLQNGYLSINDVRRREGLAPIAGGDVYRVQVNTAPVASANQAGPDGKAPDAAPAPAASDDEKDASTAGPVENETADMMVA